MLAKTTLVRLATAFALLSVSGCGGGNGADPEGAARTSGATAAATQTPQPDPAEPTEITEAGASAVEIEGDWLAAGAGSIWLSDPPASEIHRLDGETGETTATIAVPQGPCAASDFGFDALWTLTCEKPGLARVDPATNRATHLPLPASARLNDGEASVAAGEGGVWLAARGGDCESCVVLRVDPESLRVVARVRVDEGAAAVRAGEGAVWVTNPEKSLVQKIDPATNEVAATTRVGPEPRFLAVGQGAVWTLNQGDGSVTRIEPASGDVASTIGADVVGRGGDITAGGGYVWARGRGYLLTRIDPGTNEVVQRYGPSVGSGGVIVGLDAVWVSAHDARTVWRLPIPR